MFYQFQKLRPISQIVFAQVFNTFYSRGSTKMFPSEITYHKFNNFKSILWLLGGAVQNICPFYMWEGLPFRPQSFGISKKMCKSWSRSRIELRPPGWQTNALTTRLRRISYKWRTFASIYKHFQEKNANFQYKLGSTVVHFTIFSNIC